MAKIKDPNWWNKIDDIGQGQTRGYSMELTFELAA